MNHKSVVVIKSNGKSHNEVIPKQVFSDDQWRVQLRLYKSKLRRNFTEEQFYESLNNGIKDKTGNAPFPDEYLVMKNNRYFLVDHKGTNLNSLTILFNNSFLLSGCPSCVFKHYKETGHFLLEEVNSSRNCKITEAAKNRIINNQKKINVN